MKSRFKVPVVAGICLAVVAVALAVWIARTSEVIPAHEGSGLATPGGGTSGESGGMERRHETKSGPRTEATQIDPPKYQHYFAQLRQRRIPWEDIDGFLNELADRLPKKEFQRLMVGIADFDQYTPEEKAHLFNEHVSPDGGQSGYQNSMTYMMGADLESAHAFAKALEPSLVRETLFNGYYSTRCTSVEALLAILTSDVPKEHPNLGATDQLRASVVASVVSSMSSRDIATPGEALQAVKDAEIEPGLKEWVTKEIQRQHSSWFRSQRGSAARQDGPQE